MDPITLKIVDTFYYYDQPLIYSATDTNGEMWLGSVVDTSNKATVSIYVRITETQLDDLRADRISFKSIFTNPVDGNCIVEYCSSKQSSLIVIKKSSTIPNAWLPNC